MSEELDLEKLQESELVIQPIFEEQCRICNFSKTHVDIYNLLSKLALNGESFKKMEASIQAYVNVKYHDIKAPSKKTILNHLQSHIPVEAQQEIAKQKLSKGNVVPPQTQYVEALERERKKKSKPFNIEEFDEYKELCKLYADLTEVFELTFSQARLSPEDEDEEWSITKTQNYVSMMNTRKAILTEISKMREGDKLILQAAKFVMKLFVSNIVDRSLDEFNALGEVIRKHTSEDITRLYTDATQNKFSKLIVEEAKNALEQMKKEYKLTD